jgi:uncharacterized phage protein (TIGR02220 family)
MGRYRKIDPRFWKDEKIVQLSPEEKLVALYIFTGQSNRIGLFTFSPGEAAEDVGTLPQTFGERFGNVCRTLNLGWDEPYRVLYIPTWWKYNPPENSNNVIGNLKDLDDVPNSHLVDLFAKNLDYLAENLHVTFTQTLAKRYPQRYPERSPTQEQEQEQDIRGSDLFSSSRDRENQRKDSDKKGKRKKKRSASIPAELQPAVANVIGRMNELSGADFRLDSKIVADGLVPRLKNGATEAECLIIVVDRWREWQDKPDMRQHFNPETVFREKNFEKYLNAARIHNNGTQPGKFVGG